MSANDVSPFRARSLLQLLLRGRHRGPSTLLVTRWLFLRLLGLAFLIAFVSLWVQLDGLMGSDGILPAGEYLDRIEGNLGAEAYRRLPTLAWLDSSDGFLHFLCATGTLLSLLLIAGVAPLPVLLLLWAIYLSLANVGGVFLSFQWDVLLLESAFVALFVAPRQWRPRLPCTQGPPSRTGIWLLRLLLFKLMFLSGIVKLISMDETWWQLTALDYHYFTQPLPTWTSWYAHHLPAGFHKLSVFVMFLIEIGAPFLMFVARGPRMFGCLSLIALQLLIGATGNYNFFNLLTIALCLTLLDDAFLLGLLPKRLRPLFEGRAPVNQPQETQQGRAARRTARMLSTAARAVLMALVLMLSGLNLVRECVRSAPPSGLEGFAGRVFEWSDRFLLGWGEDYLLRWSDPFRTINGYGLFRAMTTRRPEIVIEGSNDGRDWREYHFRWKVGDPAARPRFVQPHQPRLDWQMWFAALNPRGAGYWLQRLLLRIASGSPEVMELLAHDPFEGRPPRSLRLVYYDYEFTTPDERRTTGNWWKRRLLGTGNAVSLSDLER